MRKPLALIAVFAFALGACANSTVTPTSAPEVTATPAQSEASPSSKPALVPEPTSEPTPEAVEPITLDEINAALATKDCNVILAVGTSERIDATNDPAVLMAGIDAASRCLTGSYVEPTAIVPLGKVARAGDWDVKVTGKVNFNAWKAVKAENMFNDPAPKGWKMVLIPLAFTNRGDAKASLLGLGEYVIGDGTLVERTDFDDPTCGVIPKELDFFTDVRPGGTLKGNMCFVVEESDVSTLRLGVPQGLFSDDPDIEFALR